jgi:hypothetical protein
MVAVVAVAVVGVTSGSAQASGYEPEPWQPYRTTGFEAPAGKYCSFALRAEPIADEEEYRVVDRYADGTPRLYEYRGKLVDRFTNVSTGESVVRDLSGHAWHEVHEDGVTWKSFTVVGPFSAGFRAEDPYPQGYYRFDGLHSITFDADGIRHMAVDAGPAENLCETLA